MIVALSVLLVVVGLFALVCAAGWYEAHQLLRVRARELDREYAMRKRAEGARNGGAEWRWPMAR